MLPTDQIYVDRAALARVFTDPATLNAIETVIQVVNDVPGAVNDNTQGVADAQADADAAAAAAAAASGIATDVAGAPIVTFTATAALSNERVVTAADGVSFDISTPGQIKVVVDALAILNALASIVLTTPVDVQGALQCDSLRIDAAPAVSATAASHALPINLNGTTYYLKLSATP